MDALVTRDLHRLLFVGASRHDVARILADKDCVAAAPGKGSLGPMPARAREIPLDAREDEFAAAMVGASEARALIHPSAMDERRAIKSLVRLGKV